MQKTVEKFSVLYLQILMGNGECDEKDMPYLSKRQIQEIYFFMVLARKLDERMLNLQRQGRIGTFAPSKGQEASSVGSAYALEPKDWIIPSFREIGGLLVRGMPIDQYLLYYAGDERGSNLPKGINIFPTSIPVGTQPAHAVGFAIAARMKKENLVVITYFGDGGTSEGDFHEAMNFAGIFFAPVVFICQNNQYAISVPRSKQTRASTIAQKAISYGFPGIQVDGNDVFAVYKATLDAVKRARDGNGPTFIECVTYRLGDHTTADDASKYRSKEEVEAWSKKYPIDRLERYMRKKALLDDIYKEKMLKQAQKASLQLLPHDAEQLF